MDARMINPRVAISKNGRAFKGQRGQSLFEDIETLFKVEPPFVDIEDGFGYVGVVLYDKTADKIQCHICGEWVSHLPSHAWNRHHIKSADYRRKFQLPLSYPLVSHGISGKINKVNLEKKLWLNFKNGKNRGPGGKRNNNARYARNNVSFQNKNGLCEKQMVERYILVAETIGRDPSEKEILSTDSALAWAIRERFGSINKFKRKNGFEQYKFKKSAVGCLNGNKNAIRARKGMSFLSKEEKEGLIKHFGSYRRAVSYIGMDF